MTRSANTNLNLLQEGFRWFGPGDTAPLSYIRQAGATAIFTSLHQIPYGERWSREQIRERKKAISDAGMEWAVVESVPVHEDIKTGKGDLKTLFRNYTETLENLAAEDIKVVIYNFMPVLDWVRTDMNHVLPDGSECMYYDPVRFAAFEVHALKRHGAEADYSKEQLKQAGEWWRNLTNAAQSSFVQTIIDVFPGVKWGLTLDDIRARLQSFSHMGPGDLERNLARFLEAVIPTVERVGMRMAIHPDDPPFPVLGLPRIASTAAQMRAIFKMAPSPANGLCFCTGSFSAREDNHLEQMAKEFGPRIHTVHLRSTKRLADGSFFEADHLTGSVDMPAVMRALLTEQDRRVETGRADWQLAFRPDHGHTMMDDLGKPVKITPGYSCIGRMRGLSELRGLMLGLRYAEAKQ